MKKIKTLPSLMVVWDQTLAGIRSSELPLSIPIFFSFGGTIIPLTKSKLYSIPRFENEKEKKKQKKKKKNDFTIIGTRPVSLMVADFSLSMWLQFQWSTSFRQTLFSFLLIAIYWFKRFIFFYTKGYQKVF